MNNLYYNLYHLISVFMILFIAFHFDYKLTNKAIYITVLVVKYFRYYAFFPKLLLLLLMLQ